MLYSSNCVSMHVWNMIWRIFCSYLEKKNSLWSRCFHEIFCLLRERKKDSLLYSHWFHNVFFYSFCKKMVHTNAVAVYFAVTIYRKKVLLFILILLFFLSFLLRKKDALCSRDFFNFVFQKLIDLTYFLVFLSKEKNPFVCWR